MEGLPWLTMHVWVRCQQLRGPSIFALRDQMFFQKRKSLRNCFGIFIWSPVKMFEAKKWNIKKISWNCPFKSFLIIFYLALVLLPCRLPLVAIQYTLQNCTVPHFSTPHLSLPHLSLPYFSTPHLSLPHLSLLHMSLPTCRYPTCRYPTCCLICRHLFCRHLNCRLLTSPPHFSSSFLLL